MIVIMTVVVIFLDLPESLVMYACQNDNEFGYF